jgi:hypothetical protein
MTTLAKKTARSGFPLDCGTYTITLTGASLTGSKAVLKLGVVGNVTTTIDSSTDATGQLTWNAATGAAVVNLSAATVDALPQASSAYQLHVVLSDSTPVYVGTGIMSRIQAM